MMDNSRKVIELNFIMAVFFKPLVKLLAQLCLLKTNTHFTIEIPQNYRGVLFQNWSLDSFPKTVLEILLLPLDSI